MPGCKARHLGVGNKGFASLFHYHHHNKVIDFYSFCFCFSSTIYLFGYLVLQVTVKFKLEMGSMEGKTKGCEKADREAVAGSSEERKEFYSRSFLKEQKYRNGGFSGSVPINKPLVSSHVSWRVPSKNQHSNQDKHPGLFSDYSRPRTRPPSHN